MTSRTVKIVDISEGEIAAHFHLEGVNCSPREFIDWFMIIEFSENRSNFIPVGDDGLCDLGGDPREMPLGGELTIEFNQYFNALVKYRISEANKQLDSIGKQFRLKHGLPLSVTPEREMAILNPDHFSSVELYAAEMATLSLEVVCDVESIKGFITYHRGFNVKHLNSLFCYTLMPSPEEPIDSETVNTLLDKFLDTCSRMQLSTEEVLVRLYPDAPRDAVMEYEQIAAQHYHETVIDCRQSEYDHACQYGERI